MEQRTTLYTHGNFQIKVEKLIPLLQSYDINCVVDCRPLNNSPIYPNTPLDSLRETLKQHNIVYLPFFQHFGFFPCEVRNKQGKVVYKKAIKSENFLQGIQRIQKGLQKGYHICIIDNQKETARSTRYTLIGEYLKDTYHILHIDTYGHSYSQEQITQKIEQYQQQRKQKKNEAQKLGQTGEELTALYLTKEGYQILDHNWNLHRGCELDLVAVKDNKLHFIEVKTRSSDQYGEPQVAINYHKMRNIIKAIQQYRFRRCLFHVEYQIDSVAIIYHTENDYTLKHFLDIRPNGEACAACNTYTPQP